MKTNALGRDAQKHYWLKVITTISLWIALTGVAFCIAAILLEDWPWFKAAFSWSGFFLAVALFCDHRATVLNRKWGGQ